MNKIKSIDYGSKNNVYFAAKIIVFVVQLKMTFCFVSKIPVSFSSISPFPKIINMTLLLFQHLILNLKSHDRKKIDTNQSILTLTEAAETENLCNEFRPS